MAVIPDVLREVRPEIATAVAKSRTTLRDEGSAVLVRKARSKLRLAYESRRVVFPSPRATALVSSGRVSRGSGWPNHLCVLVPPRLADRYQRRLDNLLSIARSQRIPATATPLGSPQEMRSLVAMSSAVILFQLPWSRTLEPIVAEARRLGMPVLYLACDPSHDPAYMHEWARAQGLSPDQRRQILASCAGYRRALKLADHAIAGRAALAERLSPLCPQGAQWLPYAADDWLVTCIRALAAEGAGGSPTPGQVKLGYDSHWLGYDPDLASIAGALSMTLQTAAEARLVVVGEPTLPDRLRPYRDQIDVIAALPPGERLRELARCDIILGPSATPRGPALVDQFIHLHAAALGRPFVGSNQAFQGIAGGNAMLCDTSMSWREALAELVANGSRRTALGSAGAGLVESDAPDAGRLLVAALQDLGVAADG